MFQANLPPALRTLIVLTSLFIAVSSSAAQELSAAISDRVQSATVQIRTQGKVSAIGSGFIVDAKGTAITNYHVVKGCWGATVAIGPQGELADVELLQVDKDRDLAVIRLTSGSRSSFPFLELAPQTPALGASVWSFGFPHGMGLTVTKGSISAERTSDELRTRFDPKAFPVDCVWLQTDAAINPGNSGGPLVLGDGRVVGVNTFFAVAGNDEYFAIHANEVARLLRNVPKIPIGFEAVRRDTTTEGGHELPMLQLRSDIRPVEVTRRAQAMSRVFLCRACKGTGITETRRPKSKEVNGVIFGGYDIVKKTCSVCDGEKVAARDRHGPTMEKFIESLSSVAVDDEQFKAHEEVWWRELRSIADPLSASSAAQINEAAKRSIESRREEIGKPQWMLCQSVSGSDPGAGTGLRILKVIDADFYVALLNPVLDSSVPSKNGISLVGGMLAGKIQIGDDLLVVVLQRGFAVPCGH